MSPRSPFWLMLGFVIGGLLVVGSDKAFSAAPSPSQLLGSVYLRAPSNLPVSAAYDAVVPGTDWTYDYNSSADNGARVSKPLKAKVGGTGLVIDVGRNIPASNLAKAGRFAMRATGVGGAIMLGLEVIDMIFDEESGQWMVPDAGEWGAYPAGTGIWFHPGSTSSCGQSFVNSTPCTMQQAMHAIESQYSASYPVVLQPWAQVSSTSWSQVRRAATTSHQVSISVTRHSVNCPGSYVEQAGYCVSESNHRPANDQDIEDAIYVELVARGIGSDLARRLIEAGYIPDMDPIETSGPSSVPGETTTTQNADGTTTTTTTDYDVSYDGDTVTVEQTKTTTTTDASGNVTGTSTETTSPGPGQGQEQEPQYDLTYTNSDLPPVPELYEQKYPDGLEGVWEEKKAEIMDTSFVSGITAFSDGAPNGGVCPSWSLNLNFGVANFGTRTLQPPCEVWPFARVVILICALFLARRLVFGG